MISKWKREQTLVHFRREYFEPQGEQIKSQLCYYLLELETSVSNYKHVNELTYSTGSLHPGLPINLHREGFASSVLNTEHVLIK